MTPRRLLLVSHLAPPSPISAARRTAGFAKHLARQGHDVTVLSSVLSGPGHVAGARRTVKTRDLMRSNLNWRRENFSALESGSSAVLAPSRVADLFVPDMQALSWLPFSLPRALSLARRERFDCAWLSGPPPSTLLLGPTLHAAGVPWIADLRDGWRFEQYRAAWPSRAHERLDIALERYVFTRADGATAVTEPIAADLRERFSVHARAISNGFDPEEDAELGLHDAPAPGVLRDGRHSLLYTGKLGYAIRDHRPFLEGVKALRRRDPETAAKLDVVFAGPLSQPEHEAIEHPDLGGLVRAVGSMDRVDALRLQRATDSLLLITCGTVGETGQKLFEYLAADRPIFVLGDESEAARIVERSSAGIVVSRHDPEGVADGLHRLLEARAAPAHGAAAQFTYETLARELTEEIERAIVHHWRSR